MIVVTRGLFLKMASLVQTSLMSFVISSFPSDSAVFTSLHIIFEYGSPGSSTVVLCLTVIFILGF